MNPSPSPVRRALLSVSDKSGITEFARSLAELNIELLSTGGTYRQLKENGVPVTEISEYTGFPEMMDGRVKTLHPKIHGGILGRRGQDDSIMSEYDIPPIDLVVVNLYPFKAAISRPDCSLENAIENIDIGGPTMLRAAAKNHDHVAVVVDPADYDEILEDIRAGNGQVSAATRNRLAVKTFEHTAQYDGAIANYLGCIDTASPEAERRQFPQTWNSQFVKKQELRYGENPHQAAAFYTEDSPQEAGISTAVQLQGKALSYNNIADTDAALECVKSFNNPACVIVKHANPCGVAEGESLLEAYNRAYQTDPTSAFGGIIAFNRELDEFTATAIIERQFSEVIIAPSVSKAASKAMADKPNVRLLFCGQWKGTEPAMNYKRVNGGLLLQDRDLATITEKDIKTVTRAKPTPEQINDLLFAWKVVKFVKSNAIIYAKNLQTIGIGAGQMSRVYSARIAGIKAADEGLTVSGSVMASDAFFPFPDSVEAAAEAGITAIIQPGGAMKDDDVITAADKAGIAMVFTGIRHFLH